MKVRKEDKHGYLEREKEKRDARAEARKETLDFIVTMAVVALAVFLLMRFVIINARIPTASMEETICVNDRIFGNRLAYLNHDPERYDIVVFKHCHIQVVECDVHSVFCESQSNGGAYSS